LSENFYTAECKEFMESDAKKLVDESKSIADVKSSFSDSYDGVFMSGGHGTYADFWNSDLCECISSMYARGKVISAVCHGPVALANPELKKEDGTPLVAGHEVCCFTDTEETAVGVIEKVPYSVEGKLKELGAIFKGGADWGSNVVVSGKLVTGQNPASSTACADAVVRLLSS
jgi:putative intracellular protease/amidase